MAAFVFHSGNGFDNLIVANNGDGHLALLEGSAEGLILADIQENPELPNPTALALLGFHRGPGRSSTPPPRVARPPLFSTFQLGGETGGPPTTPRSCSPYTTRRCLWSPPC